MLDQNPLNPELYDALQRSFKNVAISKAGIPRSVSYLPDWEHAGRKRSVASESGEYYHINCPYCKESRQRLYINHEWGETDPHTGWRNLHLACCFNHHECLTTEARRQDLYDRVYPLGRTRGERRKQPPPTVTPLLVPREFSLPAGLVLLHELPPDHLAAAYWLRRGFNLQELGHWWQVAYCESCTTVSPAIHERVVIPIYDRQTAFLENQARQRLAGWQARLVTEAGPQIPKYLTCRECRRPNCFITCLWHCKLLAPCLSARAWPTSGRWDRRAWPCWAKAFPPGSNRS